MQPLVSSYICSVLRLLMHLLGAEPTYEHDRRKLHLLEFCDTESCGICGPTDVFLGLRGLLVDPFLTDS
jgi:hypothetical protein